MANKEMAPSLICCYVWIHRNKCLSSIQLFPNQWTQGRTFCIYAHSCSATHQECLANMLLSPEIPPEHQDEVTVETGKYFLVPLSATSDKQRVQRKCIVCSRVHHCQQKASWYCVKCGNKAVLCLPNTGRTCFLYHMENGLPP